MNVNVAQIDVARELEIFAAVIGAAVYVVCEPFQVVGILDFVRVGFGAAAAAERAVESLQVERKPVK